jgi:uncharacterized membrane protein
MCAFKPVYAPLLLIAAPMAFRRGASRRTLGAVAMTAVVPLACALLWFGWGAPLIQLPRAGTSVPQQVALLLEHPFGVLSILCRSLVLQSPWLVLGAIGRFGWLTIWLPNLLYALPAAALLCALFAPTGTTAPLSAPRAAWNVALLLSAALLVMLGMYLLWTPPGASEVQGVQGRYFLPLAPLAAVCFESLAHTLSLRPRPALEMAVLPILALESVLAALVIANAYSVF